MGCSSPPKKDNTAYGKRIGNVFIRPSFSETAPPTCFDITKRKTCSGKPAQSTKNKRIKNSNEGSDRSDIFRTCSRINLKRNMLEEPTKSNKKKRANRETENRSHSITHDIECPKPKLSNFSVQWGPMYEEVCHFQNKHGHLNFPYLASNITLRNWWKEAIRRFKRHEKGMSSSFDDVRQFYRLRRLGINFSKKFKANIEIIDDTDLEHGTELSIPRAKVLLPIIDDEHSEHGTETSILVTKVLFPVILHGLLSNPELSHIFGWMPCGRVWRIIKPEAVEEEVLPKYFPRQTQYKSFTRQVICYFQCCPERYAYKHDLFLRDHPEKAHDIIPKLKEEASSLTTGRWEQSFESLCAFNKINGHMNIPTELGHIRLYEWTQRQRMRGKNCLGMTPMTEEQFKKLNGIGFDFGKVKCNSNKEPLEDWKQNYRSYSQNKKKFGNDNIPSKDKQWGYEQRRRYNCLKLDNNHGIVRMMSQEKVKLLEKIEFDFTKKHVRIQLAQEMAAKKNGKSLSPITKKTTSNVRKETLNPILASAKLITLSNRKVKEESVTKKCVRIQLSQEMTAKKNGKSLSPITKKTTSNVRKETLNPISASAKLITLSNRKVKEESGSLTTKWNRFFEMLCAFKKKIGHINVPRVEEHMQLYDWTRRQVKRGRNCPGLSLITEEQFKRLIGIGFDFGNDNNSNRSLLKFSKHSFMTETWKRNYRDYAKNQKKFVNDKLSFVNKQWVYDQRKYYHRLKFDNNHGILRMISKEKVELLEKIEFDFAKPSIKKYVSHEIATNKNDKFLSPVTEKKNSNMTPLSNKISTKKNDESLIVVNKKSNVKKHKDLYNCMWKRFFKNFCAFKKKFGHINITFAERSLWETAKRIRDKAICGCNLNPITRHYFDKLKELGFDFDGPNSSGKSLNFSENETTETWRENYNNLLKYYKRYGKGAKPVRRGPHCHLNRWLYTQKTSYYCIVLNENIEVVRSINQEKFHLLEKAGFDFAK